MINRIKMCSKKISFTTKGKAEAVGLKFKQRVYECPICFCWHTTSKENWKDEFVRKDYHERCMAQLESKIRNELNEKNRKLSQLIFELQMKK